MSRRQIQASDSSWAHLRRTRTEGAHRDLLAADPRTTAIARIAAHRGFSWPGHFAAHYRGTYKISPRTTLHLHT
ncbi:hypothetical protein [Streptomyces sp. NPDC001914]|uniref:hypothetical protein n=1 Tax=Streptomyces sp. NPDC001914 TaxID=3364623 RepID=UPI003685F95B